MASASTALTVQERVEQSVVAQQLSGQGRALVSLLGSELEVRRYQRLALQAIAKTPALQECTPDSLVLAIVEAAGMGLRHFGAGGAWLVPYRVNVGSKDNPRWESHAQMIPDYRAIVAIITRKGSEVRALEARVVKEGDAFDFGEGDYGTWVEHKPSLDADRSQRVTTHIYTRAHLRAGGPPLYHVIDRGRAEAIRLRAKKKGAFSPWDSDWDEMAKKSCAKAHAKWLPVPADVLDLFAREDALSAGEPEPAPLAAVAREPRTRQLAARLRPEPVADPAPEDDAQGRPAEEPVAVAPVPTEPDPEPQRPSEGDEDMDAVWRAIDADAEPAAAAAPVVPETLTTEAFVAFIAEHRISPEYAKAAAESMFGKGARLSGSQRAELARELVKES